MAARPRQQQPGDVDRIARVNEILKREIADLLQREPAQDGLLVSVTRVECSTTLKQADVFISIFGKCTQADEEAVLQRLNKKRGEIQHRVSRHVILKYTPVLRFVIDRNLAEGDRVIQLLRALEENENS